MAKSLADLRANPQKSRAERSVTVCLAPHLVAEVQALTEEMQALPVMSALNAEGERAGPPRKMGQPAEHPRAAEIRERLTVLLEEMAEHEGELRVRAVTDGEWRRWANEHPGRGEDEKGYARDQEVTFGYCNADALLDSLATYAYTWNGDPLADEDWKTVLEPNIAGPDLKQIATAVVAMHEARLDFRQWRNGLSDNLNRFADSVSPGISTSPPDDSTAGSPEPSSEATGKTGNPAA